MIKLDSKEPNFPDPRFYEGYEGLVAEGGELTSDWLILAYENGLFPWFNPEEEILWWSPDPRFVLFPTEVKISESMRKVMKRQVFRFTENQAFEEVLSGCRYAPRPGQDGTWLSDEMVDAYMRLYSIGKARSIEAWQGNNLVGGFYGVDLEHIFCGESMFARVSNASKACLIYFCLKYFRQFQIIDCQVHSVHLESMGARYISKAKFYEILDKNKG